MLSNSVFKQLDARGNPERGVNYNERTQHSDYLRAHLIKGRGNRFTHDGSEKAWKLVTVSFVYFKLVLTSVSDFCGPSSVAPFLWVELPLSVSKLSDIMRVDPVGQINGCEERGKAWKRGKGKKTLER